MIVYHGSIITVDRPDVNHSYRPLDFGKGFYVTSVREQAERWALRRSKIQSRKSGVRLPAIVNVYEWERTDKSDIMEFDGASMEWLDMVVNCRSNLNYRHDHDIVIGKIADDNVGETVSYVIQGIMRKEDAVERLKFEKINNQIAFRTEKALSQLKFIRSYIVEEKI